MEKLEEFFKDIKRIANAMEKIVADNNEANVFINNTLEEVKSKVTNAVDKNVVLEQSQIAQPIQPVQPAVPTVIPVTNVQHAYTMDELSLAMARALDMGMMTEIQNLMAQFNVSCLAELNPSLYNDLALKLREIGVEV